MSGHRTRSSVTEHAALPEAPVIYVDADACPVKEEVERVAERHGLAVWMVSNGGIRPSRNPLIRNKLVPEGPDAADDWIAETCEPKDIVITRDIPLADRCVKRGAAVIDHGGKVFDEQSIGMALATRDLMTQLRDTGTITGGGRSFTKQDRSRFLSELETIVRRKQRGL
jgi:uncharacterized protein YaiI (UPF0178 family)